MTEPKTIDELKAEIGRSFTICGCKGKVVTTEDGKKHFEIECKSKADREEVAALFEEEAILRVNPKVILDDEPPAVPDTRLNPTES
ncbi:unnamed protein product [marine sediment metagenome]|uniref:Uncharacterized protein n=1 Tax=marine sediment metagenome TaxID=412755 RepID=X1JY09_9ZZZZ